MNLIQVDKETFFQLVNEAVQRILESQDVKEDKWVTTDEAMALLKIKSKSTLQKLRDEGRIRFTQPERKYILYDRTSLLDFLDKHVQEPFV